RRNRSRPLGYSLATRIPYREEYVNTFIDNFIYVYKGGIPLQKLLYEENVWKKEKVYPWMPSWRILQMYII
ncbi:MAG: hypothetical protein UF734_08365, partial [Clostridium sp.]|nr:hypothetical protein [Clostridium sp.]